MAEPAEVLFVGLDACDPTIAIALARQGRLPTLGRLQEEAAEATVKNPYGLFVGTLWSTFFTSWAPARNHFFCWEEIDRETYERRLTSPADIRGRPFWEALSAAGRRVAVVDVPHTRPSFPLNGVQVSEWGCHDRHYGIQTWPPTLRDDLLGDFGTHPIFGMDALDEREFAPDDYIHRGGERRTAQEEHALLRGLLEGAERKADLSAHLLSQGGWDLFLAVLGESHAVGHQQWHLHDAAHPRHHDATTALGDPLIQVYEQLDAALARHLELVTDETLVLVLLSHGMGPHHDGTHLLEAVLHRVEAADAGGPLGSPAIRGAKRVWRSLPPGGRRAVRRPVAAAARVRTRRQPPERCREYATAPERAQQRFFLAPNNFVFGGVRINLEGREPEGRVRPGRNFDDVCRQLRDDLLDLVNVATGDRVVRTVERTDAHHSREADDTLPDLLIDWDHSAPIETVWSAKTGIVHAPYLHWRTGDHLPDGRLFLRGPGVPPGVGLPDVKIIDLAPTIAARLGVALEGVDGHPLPWLIGEDPGA